MAVEGAIERIGAIVAAGLRLRAARRMWTRLCPALCFVAMILPVNPGTGSMRAQAQQTADPASSAAAGQSDKAGQAPGTNEKGDQKKQAGSPAQKGQPGQSTGQANGSSSQASGQISGQAAGQASAQAGQNSQTDQAGQSDLPDSDVNESDDPYLRDDGLGNSSAPAGKKPAHAEEAGHGAKPLGTDAETQPGAAREGGDSRDLGTDGQPTSAADEAAPAVAAAVAVPSGPLTPEEARKQRVANECADLLKMASDLKAAVDRTSKDELSIAVIRKAGEIEQYAHKVRSDPGLTAGKE